MRFAIIFAFTILPMIVESDNSERLGDVHTSTAFIVPLATNEDRIVELLSSYVRGEERRLATIRKYIEDWRSGHPRLYVENPLASYHLFKRIVYDFAPVEKFLSENGSKEVLDALKAVRGPPTHLPTETDINGVAWSIVRLQNVYDLPFDDVIKGVLRDARETKGLNADDCLRLGDESFKNLEFELSKKWTEKAIEILGKQNPVTKENEDRIQKYKNLIIKRNIMKEFVITMAKRADSKVYGQFSGLGIPKSFTKELYNNAEKSKDVDRLEKSYNKLCRGELMQVCRHMFQESKTKTSELNCYYSFGSPSKFIFQPFKSERVSTKPHITIYHDVLSDDEINQIKQLALPILKTAQVKPYSNVRNMKSIAKIGKSGWLHRTNHSLVERLLKRVEVMTGLNTRYADELHVLNYGVGGLYELHVDFFDFANLNDVHFGGSTVFPFLNVGVKPEKGSVVVWYNLHRNGSGDFKTMHSSCPVLLGQKWIATLWLNEKGQEFLRPCLLNPSE